MNKIVTSYLQKTGFRNIDLKAVLIDMDGVLYDSMPFHADAWYKAISSLGIACTPEEFFMYEGRTGASTIDLIFNRAYGRNADENEKQMIYARKCEYFVAKGVAPVMPGALDFLRQVKSHGLIPVLVTGSGQHSLLDKLSHDYPGIFTPQTMVTAFDVKYGKPDPEPYLIGLEKAGVQPWWRMRRWGCRPALLPAFLRWLSIRGRCPIAYFSMPEPIIFCRIWRGWLFVLKICIYS